jgi:hypothetical protein
VHSSHLLPKASSLDQLDSEALQCGRLVEIIQFAIQLDFRGFHDLRPDENNRVLVNIPVLSCKDQGTVG